MARPTGISSNCTGSIQLSLPARCHKGRTCRRYAGARSPVWRDVRDLWQVNGSPVCFSSQTGTAGFRYDHRAVIICHLPFFPAGSRDNGSPVVILMRTDTHMTFDEETGAGGDARDCESSAAIRAMNGRRENSSPRLPLQARMRSAGITGHRRISVPLSTGCGPDHPHPGLHPVDRQDPGLLSRGERPHHPPGDPCPAGSREWPGQSGDASGSTRT